MFGWHNVCVAKCWGADTFVGESNTCVHLAHSKDDSAALHGSSALLVLILGVLVSGVQVSRRPAVGVPVSRCPFVYGFWCLGVLVSFVMCPVSGWPGV